MYASKSKGFALGSVLALAGLLVFSAAVSAGEIPVSDATQSCIDCHATFAPAMVADWKKSRHARITPAEALKKPELERRVSAEKIPDKLMEFAVGCAECHMLNPENHKDAFDHNDQKVHLTVTPKDCSTCHPVEADQFDKNLMSHAWGNLAGNKVFDSLVKSINGVQSVHGMKTSIADPDAKTNADSCYQCHGTEVRVEGKRTKDTDQGEMEFPILSGWPNQGVGRINPDGSKGSCSACHTRHQFAIEMARKPYACEQCHKGPDVPAYRAYSASKHGGMFFALRSNWNFKDVPWKVGEHFTAPTCAACHASLVVTGDGDVVAKRTHQMNDRIPWRVFGLIYSHAHPKSPDTTTIKNKNGLPLPTTLGGEPAAEFLINGEEQNQRRMTLQKVCKACHTTDWVDGHWDRFENTLKTSDAMTLTATEILKNAWDNKLADNTNLFDEAIEKKWVEQWLFYANSTRLASAMMGADYGAFDNGRWSLSKNVQDMLDHVRFLKEAKPKEKPDKAKK